jgi:septin family protein
VSDNRPVLFLFSFLSLPNQVYRRAVKKGFEFTLMVVGESGLGKSTLINSMFLADIYSPEYPGPSHRIKKTVQVCFGIFLFFFEKLFPLLK